MESMEVILNNLLSADNVQKVNEQKIWIENYRMEKMWFSCHIVRVIQQLNQLIIFV